MTKRIDNLKEEKIREVFGGKFQNITIMQNGKQRNVWQAKVKGKTVRRYTRNELIHILYEMFYGDEEPDAKPVIHTVKEAFYKALEHGSIVRGWQPNTIYDYQKSFKAFVTAEFAKRDVKSISAMELDTYMCKKIRKEQMKEKRVKRMKGLFNLIFDYASDPDVGWIHSSPVKKSNAGYRKLWVKASRRPEDKAFSTEEICMLKECCYQKIASKKYPISAFVILLSCNTGMRSGELCALSWDDIGSEFIHVHSQLLTDPVSENKKTYYIADWTKGEKGVPQGGRDVPLTSEAKKCLMMLKQRQKEIGIIHPEYVFSQEDGTWYTTAAYEVALARMTRSLGLKLTNNHAIRMYFCSYVLMPCGADEGVRAAWLGHTPETDIRCYTFGRRKESLLSFVPKLEPCLMVEDRV